MTEKKRLYLMQNAYNRFFYDKLKNTIHDRQCYLLNTIRDAAIEPVLSLSPKYMSNKQLCPRCMRTAAIRNSLQGRNRTSTDQLRCLSHFFNQINASTTDLARLFIYERGTSEYLAQNCVELHVHEDTWRIISKNGQLQLQHNNYKMNDDHTRTFTDGFHIQSGHNYLSFYAVVDTITKYSFEYHRRELEEYDKKVKLLHFESGLAIANNYASSKDRSILHEYYTYIRINEVGTEHNQVGGMKILHCKEQGDYSIVTCRIPRWKHSEFEILMKAQKAKALDEHRFEYLDLCEENVPQIA